MLELSSLMLMLMWLFLLMLEFERTDFRVCKFEFESN